MAGAGFDSSALTCTVSWNWSPGLDHVPCWPSMGNMCRIDKAPHNGVARVDAIVGRTVEGVGLDGSGGSPDQQAAVTPYRTLAAASPWNTGVSPSARSVMRTNSGIRTECPELGAGVASDGRVDRAGERRVFDELGQGAAQNGTKERGGSGRLGPAFIPTVNNRLRCAMCPHQEQITKSSHHHRLCRRGRLRILAAFGAGPQTAVFVIGALLAT
jgi:hypothetical protein